MTALSGHSIIIMLGSNAGNRRANLDRAVDALSRRVAIESTSSDLDNPDITGKGADYLNRLVFGHTALSPQLLDAYLKEIETDLGRDRSHPGSVIIDIDTVICDGTIVRPKEYDSAPFRALLDSMRQRQ